MQKKRGQLEGLALPLGNVTRIRQFKEILRQYQRLVNQEEGKGPNRQEQPKTFEALSAAAPLFIVFIARQKCDPNC